MTTDNETKKTLSVYSRKTLWAACVLLSLLIGSALISYVVGSMDFFYPLLGSFVGACFASINLFAIAYAFFVIAVKNGPRTVVVLPILSFVAMCICAFLCAKWWSSLLLGFALGLTAPLFFAAVVIF